MRAVPANPPFLGPALPLDTSTGAAAPVFSAERTGATLAQDVH